MIKKTYWHSDATPVETTLDRVLYDLRKDDTGGLLFDAVTFADIYADADSVMTLDALIVPFAKLTTRMNAIMAVMGRAGTDIKPIFPVSAADDENHAIIENPTISKPIMANGVANVVVRFELTDGQVVSIYFHNPDIDPKKITATDDLISWKWMLNRLDITIAVAPEKGVDLNIRQVAVRVMKLAQKNSAAFLRKNTDKAEKLAIMEGLTTEITALTSELKSAKSRLEIAKQESDDREIAALTNPPVEVVNVDGFDYTPIDLSIDGAKAEWNKALSESENNEFQAAKNVYQQVMQGHYVNTSIGKVFISGSGWREIKDGLKKDSLRAQTVPYIVEILKEGSVGAFDTNQKLDKKPDVVGYYPFTKTVEVDGKLVTALLKVEQKEKGEFVYHLRTSSDSTLDSAHENASLLRLLPDSLAFRELAEPTLDSIVEPNTGGVNIIILKVTDLEGNEIKELEDSVDDENTIAPESVTPAENTVAPQGIDPVEAVQKWVNNDADKPPFESLEKEILNLESNGDLNFKINGVLFYATKHNTINSNDRKISSQGRQFDGNFGSEINQWLTSLGKVQIGGATNYEKVVEKIDPVAKANIEAANITVTMKKNAIKYLNENPTSHQLFEKETPAGKKAYVAIMENLKTALFAEVNALNPLFMAYQNYTTMTLRGKDNERLVGFTVKVDENYKMTFGVNDYSGSTENTEIEVYKNIFDSTSTIEELRQWGFMLPFDLDVKAFVANVIKPVVDELLAKIEAEAENVGQNEVVELGVDDTRKKIEDEIAHLEEVVKTGFDNGKRLVPTSARNKGFALNDAQKRLNKFNEQNPPPVSAGIAALQELAKLADKSSEPTPPETESSEIEVQPPQNATADIDAEIESLRQFIGMPEFSDALDALLDKLEAAGLDSQYETVVSDIINQDAQAESAKVGG